MWKKFWCMSKWRSDLLVLSPESGYPPHKIRYDEKCKTLWLQRVFPLNYFFSVWRVFAVSTNNLTYSQPVICVSFLTAQKQLPHFYDDVPSLSFIVASSLIFKMFSCAIVGKVWMGWDHSKLLCVIHDSVNTGFKTVHTIVKQMKP